MWLKIHRAAVEILLLSCCWFVGSTYSSIAGGEEDDVFWDREKNPSLMPMSPVVDVTIESIYTIFCRRRKTTFTIKR